MRSVLCHRLASWPTRSITKLVSTGLFAALITMGQQNHSQTTIVWPTTEPVQSPALVTVQQLRHAVPGKAQKEMQKAERARLAGHTDDAISRYKAVISIDPEYVAARNNLAILYTTIDNIKLAVEQLEEAIKVDPHNPMVFKNLAICYELAGEFVTAERVARQAIELDRSDMKVRMLLGFILIQQQKFTQEALLCFHRAMNQFALAHLLAGRVLLGQGELAKGKSEIQEYLVTGDPDNRDLALKWLASIDHSDVVAIASTPRQSQR